MFTLDLRQAALGLIALTSALPLAAQTLRVLQAAPLRSERSVDAPLLINLAAGQAVTLLQLSGGWARVQAGGTPGWLRASQLELPGADIAAVSQRETGRRQDGATAVTLGIRGVPTPRDRHALIIGIGTYQADASRQWPALPGVSHDMVGALAMSRSWRVPPEQVTLLRDGDATREGVRQALRELVDRVQGGDRVYFYWAGLGSRQLDVGTGGCVETLLPFDLRDIGPRDWEQWLRPLAAKSVTFIFIQDGGGSPTVASAGPAARAAPADPLVGSAGLVSRYTVGAEACRDPGKLGRHNVETALRDAGFAAPKLVYVTSSRPAEASFEDPASGGLATFALGRCLQGDTNDAGGGRAINLAQWVGCAQSAIDARWRGLPPALVQNLTATGNRDFVPAR